MASTKLYVGNIAHGTTAKELREVFEAFGEIEEVAVKDGFAFVHFANSDDASAALDALDNSELSGQKLLVQYSRTKGHGYGTRSGPPAVPRHTYRPRFFRPIPQPFFYPTEYDFYMPPYERYAYRGAYREPYYYRSNYRDMYARDNYRENFSARYREKDNERDRDHEGRDRSRERERER